MLPISTPEQAKKSRPPHAGLIVTDDRDYAALAKSLPGEVNVLLVDLRPLSPHEYQGDCLVQAIDRRGDPTSVVFALAHPGNIQICADATTRHALPAALLKDAGKLLHRAALERRPLRDLAGRFQVFNRDFDLSALEVTA